MNKTKTSLKARRIPYHRRSSQKRIQVKKIPDRRKSRSLYLNVTSLDATLASKVSFHFKGTIKSIWLTNLSSVVTVIRDLSCSSISRSTSTLTPGTDHTSVQTVTSTSDKGASFRFTGEPAKVASRGTNNLKQQALIS